MDDEVLLEVEAMWVEFIEWAHDNVLLGPENQLPEPYQVALWSKFSRWKYDKELDEFVHRAYDAQLAEKETLQREVNGERYKADD